MAKSFTEGEPIVIYEEDFDDYSDKVELRSGITDGWVYIKRSEDGSARIENGRLYLSGSAPMT